jgi:hypothetical protein
LATRLPHGEQINCISQPGIHDDQTAGSAYCLTRPWSRAKATYEMAEDTHKNVTSVRARVAVFVAQRYKMAGHTHSVCSGTGISDGAPTASTHRVILRYTDEREA